jgi:hypothetical protein
MKAFRKEIYWQSDLMAIKESNVACVHRRNISRYDSGERCGPWASCLIDVVHVLPDSDPKVIAQGSLAKKTSAKLDIFSLYISPLPRFYSLYSFIAFY